MIRILQEPFNIAAEIDAFDKVAQGAGAIVTFAGKVRGAGGESNEQVAELVLEHFPQLTEASIREIENTAAARWNVDDVLIIHRVGRLNPGEPIVLVCVSAAHRRDAFEAADFMMDYLKTEAMFWKKEIRKNGEEWIEPRARDYKDTERWTCAGSEDSQCTE